MSGNEGLSFDESDLYGPESGIYVPVVDPVVSTADRIYNALTREMNERGLQALNEGRSLSGASKRFTRSDILYSLEKWAPNLRNMFPSQQGNPNMGCRRISEPIEPYLSKLEAERKLIKWKDGTWTFVDSMNY
jgi:hypothetical protein